MTAVETAPAPAVLTRREGRVAVVTLNRPEARNALNKALLAALWVALDAAVEDPDTGSVVLTGNGPSFCAGADLKESSAGMDEGDFWAQHQRVSDSMRIHQRIPRLPLPVIAAVDGHAVAGGCGLAMSCDIVIASDRAQFGFPEVRRGLVAAMAMVPLSRVVGRHHALDLLLSGRIVDADEALRIGMVNRVVPHDDLLPEVLRYARQLAANSATATRITKECYRQVAELDADRALDHARDVNMLTRQTDDAQRGASAFARKDLP